MKAPKTNKQPKLAKIRATLKRARIGHHLKIAVTTALLAGLYFAGALTPLYIDQIIADYNQSIIERHELKADR